jgi:glycine/D-amino acid oxidase-like deaminating enzyme
MLPRPGVICRSAPVARLMHHVLVSPAGEIRQDATGRIVMPAAAAHQSDTAETVADLPAALAAAALERARIWLPALPDWAEVTLAERPVPGDGLPVIGAVGQGAYVAVLHSGVTLAAITGELAAQEILTGTPAALLAPYRPARFG